MPERSLLQARASGNKLSCYLFFMLLALGEPLLEKS